MCKLLILAATVGLTSVAHAEVKPGTAGDLVASYQVQLATLCGSSAGTPQRLDLNSDGRPEWIFDGACMRRDGRPGLVTIFTPDAKGRASPVFQQVAFDSNVERVNGKPKLVLTVDGSACGVGVAPDAKCTASVEWRSKTSSFALVAPAAVASR